MRSRIFTDASLCYYLCVISINFSRETVPCVRLCHSDYNDHDKKLTPALYTKRLFEHITEYDITAV